MPAPTIAAEDVLPGHPDRLCDAVAEAVVEVACAHDHQALVGVEVALHRHLLVVTGRVAAGTVTNPIELGDEDLRGLAGDVFAAAGYTGRWHHELTVVSDLDVGALEYLERDIRRFSDDQTIAVGHADPSGPDLLPIEAATARRVRRALAAARAAAPDTLGPDGKVLVVITPGSRPRLERLNVAIQHDAAVGYEDLHRLVLPHLQYAIDELGPHLDLPARLDADTVRLNGIGDFSCGGPDGDNGLSGKKLVVDHYGPQVPIGGGALCGKDPHKPDRVGPLRARQLAVRLAKATGRSATVRIGWLPGQEHPDRLAAALDDGTALAEDEISREVAVPDLTLAGSARDLELATIPWRAAIDRGYVGAGWRWDGWIASSARIRAEAYTCPIC